MPSVPQDPPSGNGRKPISKKTRFEVFRRDGFRCRYCGATPAKSPLEVDHVTPVANGGTNAASNLVTACFDCNRGKAARPLDATPLPAQDAKMAKEHAKQLAAYRVASATVEAERRAFQEQIIERWESLLGSMTQGMADRIPSLAMEWDWASIVYAIDAVRQKFGPPLAQFNSRRAVGQQKYFYGVLRRIREKGGV